MILTMKCLLKLVKSKGIAQEGTILSLEEKPHPSPSTYRVGFLNVSRSQNVIPPFFMSESTHLEELISNSQKLSIQ